MLVDFNLTLRNPQGGVYCVPQETLQLWTWTKCTDSLTTLRSKPRGGNAIRQGDVRRTVVLPLIISSNEERSVE